MDNKVKINQGLTCRLEKVFEENREGNMFRLPEAILERSDIAMVCTGTLGCIRGVFKSVAGLGKLHQFFSCVLNPKDYSSGSWEPKLKELLEKVLGLEGLGAIIIYASCVDYYGHADYDKLFQSLNNPQGIPVKVLFRGPMVTPVRPPKQYLPPILASLPPQRGSLPRDGFELPPLQPDFAGVGLMLQDWDCYGLIVEAGGCSDCLGVQVAQREGYELTKTRFNNLGAAKKCTELVPPLVKEAGISSCCFMTSAIPDMLGVKPEELQEAFSGAGIASRYLPTNGQLTELEGRAEALRRLGTQPLPDVLELAGVHQDKITEAYTQHRLINVLGTEGPQTCTGAKVYHGVEHMLQDGYTGLFPWELPLDRVGLLQKASMSWVTSMVGLPLAEELFELWGISYFAAIPIGMRCMRFWNKQLMLLMGEDNGEVLPAIAEVNPQQKQILLLGDPILTQGIKKYFEVMQGIVTVTRAVYAPEPRLEQWYRANIAKAQQHGVSSPEGVGYLEQPLYFTDVAQLRSLVQQAEAVIGDRLYQEAVGKLADGKTWLYLPDNLLGIEPEQPEDYAIFGKKGAAWLRAGLGL